jgi:hypothetical protein
VSAVSAIESCRRWGIGDDGMCAQVERGDRALGGRLLGARGDSSLDVKLVA